jgi:hypothetical protein
VEIGNEILDLTLFVLMFVNFFENIYLAYAYKGTSLAIFSSFDHKKSHSLHRLFYGEYCTLHSLNKIANGY